MSILKQYTLKVVVMVGGDDESECEQRINRIMDMIDFGYQVTTEITHEEIVEVERE